MKYLSSIIILLLSASAAVASHDYRPSKLLIATLEIDRQLGSSKSSKSKYKVFAKAKEKSKGSQTKSNTSSHSQKTSKSAKSATTNLDAVDSSDTNNSKPASQENSAPIGTSSDSAGVTLIISNPDSPATEGTSQENSISATNSNSNEEIAPNALGASKSSKSKYKVFAKAKEKSKGSKSKSSTTHSRQTSKSAKSSITNLDIDISDSERPTPENSSILSSGSGVDPTKPPPDSLAIEVPSEENSISTTDSSTDEETQPNFFEIEVSGHDNGSHSQVFTKGSKSEESKSKQSKSKESISKQSKSKESISKESKSGTSKDSHSRQTPKSVKSATTRSSKASHSKQTSSKSAKSATTKSNKSKSSSQKNSSSKGRTGANLTTPPPSPSPTGVPEENRTKFLESEGDRGSGLTTQNMIVGATALFAILATIAAVSIKRKRASKAFADEDNILDSVDISPAEAVVTPMPNRPPSSNKDVSPVNLDEYGYSCDLFGFNSCML